MRNGFRRRATVALVLATALLAGGCGRFARSGAERGSGSPPGTADVGTEVSLGASTTAPPTTAAGAAPTTSPAGRAPAGAAPRGAAAPTSEAPRDVCDGNPGPTPNLARSDDPSGLRLDLVVAERLCFAEHEGFRMQLEVVNNGSRSIYYDSNRYDVFSIAPADGRAGPTWSESLCGTGAPQGTPGPPLELAPGEKTQFAADYPPRGIKSQPHPCHNLEPGEYHVTGRIRTCPDGTRDRGYCDPDRSVYVTSAAMRIRII